MIDVRTAIRGLSEPKQRVLKFMEIIKNQDAEKIAQTIYDVLNSSQDRADPLSKLQSDLITYQEDLGQLGYEKIAAIYKYATKRDWLDVLSLFRTHENAHGTDEEKPEGYAKKLDALTLGERKQLARDVQRTNIEFLVFDEDPLVIGDLLKNPKLIERDVIRIAARHHAPPAVIHEVLKSPKWMRRYHVKKTLIFNPQTPIAQAIPLIKELHLGDLKQVTQTPTLRKELIDYAAMSIKRKTQAFDEDPESLESDSG